MSATPGAASPFATLGLPARPGLTDDEVRAAWRRIAAATHPDRPDGGAPDRFAVAAAAYTALRTASGRGEALADLADRAGRRPPGKAVAGTRRTGSASRPPGTATPPSPAAARAARLLSRIRGGRPSRLAFRILLATGVTAAAAVIAGAAPATPALAVGALTWLLCTARHDIAPPGDRR